MRVAPELEADGHFVSFVLCLGTRPGGSYFAVKKDIPKLQTPSPLRILAKVFRGRAMQAVDQFWRPETFITLYV